MTTTGSACLWCTHTKAAHNGRVDPAVRADQANAKVRWTVSACAVAGCACRTYEQRRRVRPTQTGIMDPDTHGRKAK